jgi:hypothetical protein
MGNCISAPEDSPLMCNCISAPEEDPPLSLDTELTPTYEEIFIFFFKHPSYLKEVDKRQLARMCKRSYHIYTKKYAYDRYNIHAVIYFKHSCEGYINGVEEACRQKYGEKYMTLDKVGYPDKLVIYDYMSAFETQSTSSFETHSVEYLFIRRDRVITLRINQFTIPEYYSELDLKRLVKYKIIPFSKPIEGIKRKSLPYLGSAPEFLFFGERPLFTRLKGLVLQGLHIDEKFMRKLEHFYSHSLEYLSFDGCFIEPNIDFTFTESLANFENLRYLFVGTFEFNVKDHGPIMGSLNLEALYLDIWIRCKMTVSIHGCKNMQIV